MKVVLDTNIIVSALLSPFGPPAQILKQVVSGNLTIACDDRILSEYREVLLRPRFQFSPLEVDGLLSYFEHYGDHLSPAPLNISLPDPDDLAFLESAHAADAILITGNIRHFPVEERAGVEVMTPAVFLRR